MDLNKASIIGRLTQDPDTRTIPSGQSVTTFSVATNFNWTDANGQKQDKVEYHNVVAWRRLAEICAQYLKKGKRVYIEGRLETRSWEDQNGVKKYRTEIITDNMIMLDGPGQSSGTGQTPPSPPSPEKPSQDAAPQVGAQDKKKEGEEEISVEDIPF